MACLTLAHGKPDYAWYLSALMAAGTVMQSCHLTLPSHIQQPCEVALMLCRERCSRCAA